MIRRLLAFSCLGAAAAAAAFWASPYWVLDDMAKAVAAKDEARFGSHVDYPLLRANAKASVKRAASAAASRFGEAIGDALSSLGAKDSEAAGQAGRMGEALGSALAGPGGKLADAAVDAAIGPKAMMAAMRAAAEPRPAGEEQGKRAGGLGWHVRWRGIDEFAVAVGAGEGEAEGGVLAIFRREGGLDWRLVDWEMAPEPSQAAR